MKPIKTVIYAALLCQLAACAPPQRPVKRLTGTVISGFVGHTCSQAHDKQKIFNFMQQSSALLGYPDWRAYVPPTYPASPLSGQPPIKRIGEAHPACSHVLTEALQTLRTRAAANAKLTDARQKQAAEQALLTDFAAFADTYLGHLNGGE